MEEPAPVVLKPAFLLRDKCLGVNELEDLKAHPVAGRHVSHVDLLQGGWVDAEDWVCGPLAPCDVVYLVSDEFEAEDFAVPGYGGFAVCHGNGDVVEDAVGGLGLDWIREGYIGLLEALTCVIFDDSAVVRMNMDSRYFVLEVISNYGYMLSQRYSDPEL